MTPSILRSSFISILAFAGLVFDRAALAQNVTVNPASAGSGPNATAAYTPAPVTGASNRTEIESTGLKHYVVSDYGAVADGATMNTAAIQKAIDAAAAAGGGMVEIPKGTFLSGSIFLKKGVELYLDDGAVLKGSEKIDDYPMQQTRIEGHFQQWRQALVNAQNLDWVRIEGPGQLNGSGPVYWNAFNEARRANRSVTNLDVQRPRLMYIDRCQNVHIAGLSLQDSGFWNLHVYKSHDVLVDGLHINAGRGPSTDGMDIDSCQDVTIRNCQISCNDDDIALKGSKGPFADKDTDSPPVENILIENCTIGDGNGLLTCGSEATIIHNVLVRDCNMNGRATMLTLKLRTDTPQHYSNITLDGIKLDGTGRLLNVAPWSQFFDLEGQTQLPAHRIDHVLVRNVSGQFGSFGTLQGSVGDQLQDITLENFDVTLRNPAFRLGPTENLVLNNVVINGSPYALPTPVPAAPLRKIPSAPSGAATSATATTPPNS
ncbi:MAG: glycosyl hydrolase family 28 protein [Opitutales bacterium]|jgi:polygalacturonase